MATSACRPPVAPPPLPGSDETTPTSAPSDPHLVQASSASPPADCLAGYPDRPQTIVGPPSLHGAHKLSVVPAYMDDDAWPDLVVTTGGHDAKGHVYVLFGPFHGKSEPVPAWVSTVSDHFAGLAVGDIDGDGRLDIATSIFTMDGNQEVSGRVFLAAGPRAWQPGPIQPWHSRSAAIALGDANGDGRLDLFLGAIDLDGTDPLLTATQQLFLNRGAPPWYDDDALVSPPGVDTMASTFTDMDGDGKLDVVSALAGVAWGVAYDRADLDRPHFLQCLGEPNRAFNVQLSPFRDADRTTQFAVTTSSHYCTGVFCRDRVFTQRWNACDVDWEGDVGDLMPVAVRVADFDGNAASDVLATFWTGEGPDPQPGPIGAYCGSGAARSRTLTPLGTAQFRSLGVALADLDRSHVVATIERWGAGGQTIPEGATALTLQAPVVERVTRVELDGREIPILAVPGSSWVAFPRPLTARNTVVVTYEVSTSLDIVVADYTPGDVPVFFKE